MIYAPTLYFNESELWKIRKEIMRPLGCRHIVIESKITHSGAEKNIAFPERHSMQAFYDIYHPKVYDDAWTMEMSQRNFAKEIMEGWDYKDTDIIIITDLDEIVFPEAVEEFDLDMGCASLRMDHYSGYINLLQGEQTWNVGRICSGKYLRDKTLSEIRNNPAPYEIKNAGHHYAWLGGVDKMIEKFFSYAHLETVSAKLVDPEVLKYKLESGQSLWGDDFWKFVPIDERFPAYIRDNEKYLTEIGFIKTIL